MKDLKQNYSTTTLPPGFATWNELWRNVERKMKFDGIVMYSGTNSGVEYATAFELFYQVDFIKARAYEEIMELLGKISIDDRFSLQSTYSLETIEELTHTNLFK